MKKLISGIAIAILLSSSAFAQDSGPKGNIALDINFQPAAFFDAFAGPMFDVPYIKGRYFIQSDVAVRFGVDLGLGSDKDYLDIDGDDYTTSSNFSWTLAPGIEKSFGSEKFVIFIGADLPISSLSTSTESSIGGNTTETKNQGGGYLSVGLNGVVGADYYLFPNFYVGAEFTPGFIYRKDKDQEVAGTVTQKGGSSYSFGLGASSGVRIGVRF